MKTPKTDDFEKFINQALAGQDPSREFVNAQREALKSHLLVEMRTVGKNVCSFGSLKLAVGVLAVLMVVILMAGPKKVMGGLLDLIRYVPNYGFVRNENPLVLKDSVLSADGKISIHSALATSDGTQVELRFADGARAPAQVWMENSQGKRLAMLRWEFKPDSPGAKGLILHFDPLPAGDGQWLLHLSPQTELNFAFEPALENDTLPNQLAVGTEENGERPCILASTVPICLQAASFDGDTARLLVEVKNDPNEQVRAIMPEPNNPVEAKRNPLSVLMVADEQGETFAILMTSLVHEEDANLLTYEGNIPTSFDPEASLTLALDGILVDQAVSGEIAVNLGDDPQPDQEFQIDQTLDIAGVEINFNKAVSSGSRLVITSESVVNFSPREVQRLNITRPIGVEDQYGSGYSNDTDQFTIFVELNQATGVMKGNVVFEVVSAEVLDRTPANLTFKLKNLPKLQNEVSIFPNPTVIIKTEEITSTQVTPQLSLPEEIEVSWSGTRPESGDLIVLEPTEGHSRIAFYSPDSGFAQQEFLTLPLSVSELWLTSAQDGVYFIAGEPLMSQLHSNLWAANKSLWVWRYGEPKAVKLANLPDYVIEAQFSPNSDALALRTSVSLPGNRYETALYFYDLEGCLNLACQPEKMTLDGIHVSAFTWHKNKPILAVLGEELALSQSALQLIDLSDINKPKVEEAAKGLPLFGGPLYWLSDERLLVYTRDNNLIGTYNLQNKTVNKLDLGVENGSNHRQFVNGRWMVLDTFDREANLIKLLVYDFEEERLTSLLEIPIGSTTKSQWDTFGVIGSPNSDWALVVSGALGSFFKNLVSGEQVGFDLLALPEMEVLFNHIYWLP